MIKIRSGMFETNSSSTHTCIICKKNTYERWCMGELVLVDKESLIKSLIKPEDFIEGDFIEVETLKKIPAADVFKQNPYILQRYVKEAEAFTLGDLWEVYTKINFNKLNDVWNDYEDVDDLPVQCTPEMEKVIEAYSDNWFEPGTARYWRGTFSNDLGLRSILSYRNGRLEQDITEKNIDGIDLISLCEYGHD